MTREYLEQNGILIAERDHHAYGYSGTTTTYYLPEDDCLYDSEYHTNEMTYTGKNDTYMTVKNVSNKVNDHIPLYFSLDEDGLAKLRSVVSGTVTK